MRLWDTNNGALDDMSRQAYEWAQAALITAGALVFIIGLGFLVWDSAVRMTG